MGKFEYAMFDWSERQVNFHFSQGDDFVPNAVKFLGEKGIKRGQSSTVFLKVDEASAPSVLSFLGTLGWVVCSPFGAYSHINGVVLSKEY